MDMTELGAETDPEEAPDFAPDEHGRIRVDANYEPFTVEFRRGGEGRGTLRTGRTRPPALPARPAAHPAAIRHLKARQPAPAPPAREAKPLLALRSRRGNPRHLPPAAGGDRSHEPARLQAGKGNQVPRHRGDDADRQLRLHARPLHHHRGGVRRHPGPHARTLFRARRNPRLHHACLARRPVPRGMDQRRQARQPRPPERPSTHRLQGRGRHLAPRPAQLGPHDARGTPEGEHRRRSPHLGTQPPRHPGRRNAACSW